MNRSTLRLLLLPLIAVVLLVVWTVVPVERLADDFEDWVKGTNRFRGLVVVGLSYTPAVLTFFPASVITLIAGGMFDLVEATIAVSLGSTLAACVAFWVGRTLARSWVERKAAESPRFRALDRAVADHGFRIVLLTRLSPAFPYTLLNYLYGITRVSFRSYLFASWIGMLPGTVMYLVLGKTAKGVAVLIRDVIDGNVEENLGQLLFLLVGLAATVAVTWTITRLARRALREALDRHEGEKTP